MLFSWFIVLTVQNVYTVIPVIDACGIEYFRHCTIILHTGHCPGELLLIMPYVCGE